jgi:hypothetical protein
VLLGRGTPKRPHKMPPRQGEILTPSVCVLLACLLFPSFLRGARGACTPNSVVLTPSVNTDDGYVGPGGLRSDHVCTNQTLDMWRAGQLAAGILFRNGPMDPAEIGTEYIASSFLRVRASSTHSGGLTTVNITLHRSGAPAGCTGSKVYSRGARGPVAISVHWAIAEFWEAGTWYDSPDLSSVLNEAYNFWSTTGLNLGILLFEPTGGTREFDLFESGNPPQLHITLACRPAATTGAAPQTTAASTTDPPTTTASMTTVATTGPTMTTTVSTTAVVTTTAGLARTTGASEASSSGASAGDSSLLLIIILAAAACVLCLAVGAVLLVRRRRERSSTATSSASIELSDANEDPEPIYGQVPKLNAASPTLQTADTFADAAGDVYARLPTAQATVVQGSFLQSTYSSTAAVSVEAAEQRASQLTGVTVLDSQNVFVDGSQRIGVCFSKVGCPCVCVGLTPYLPGFDSAENTAMCFMVALDRSTLLARCSRPTSPMSSFRASMMNATRLRPYRSTNSWLGMSRLRFLSPLGPHDTDFVSQVRWRNSIAFHDCD